MSHGCISEKNDTHAAKGKVFKAPKGNWWAEFIKEVGKQVEIVGKMGCFGMTFTSFRKSA